MVFEATSAQSRNNPYSPGSCFGFPSPPTLSINGTQFPPASGLSLPSAHEESSVHFSRCPTLQGYAALAGTWMSISREGGVLLKKRKNIDAAHGNRDMSLNSGELSKSRLQHQTHPFGCLLICGHLKWFLHWIEPV